MTNSSHGAICITGRGMISSLAPDVVNACAAARAGIVRPQSLDKYKVGSSDNPAGEGVVTHVAALMGEGFEGRARLVRLLQRGLADLMAQVKDPPWLKSSIPFYLSVPDPNRIFSGIDLIPNEEARKSFEAEIKEYIQEPLDPAGIQSLLNKAATSCAWPGETELKFVSSSGQVGVAEALSKAISDLNAGVSKAAIVGGLESYIDVETLEWLNRTVRLKTEDVASGFQPGEACAFVLLETTKTARKRNARIYGLIEAIAYGNESKTLLSGKPTLGKALAEAVQKLSPIARWGEHKSFWAVCDQSGERYRAMEWGNAVVRLSERSKAFSEPIVWYPAVSFGDTGAASAAVALCLATSAFEWGYAPAKTAAVISSSDGAQRAGMLLSSLVS